MAVKSDSARRGSRLGQRVRTGFAEFFQLEVAGSVALLAATVLALVLANTAAYPYLEALMHLEIGVRVGAYGLTQPLLEWVDAGLMAIFFLVVGLEIKREFVVGELSKPRNALLPILGALGGMVMPALIYLALNHTGPTARGWAIPMATDIAFALGALALLGSRAPKGLRLFLTTLAIVDDIGAICVIAIFYSSGVSWPHLLAGLALILAMGGLNRLGVDRLMPYMLLGLLAWVLFLGSGIDAAITGVLVALTIPARSRTEPLSFVEYARERLADIEHADVPGAHVLENDTQQQSAHALCRVATQTAAPLQRLEHALTPFSTFVVLPLFALLNAGVRFVGLDLAALVTSPLFLGIFLGLLLGKPLGITGMSFAAVRARWVDLPSDVAWRHMGGAGVLGGIGFTMALFIATLAFRGAQTLAEAKFAILLTSVVAGVIGCVWLTVVSARRRREAGE